MQPTAKSVEMIDSKKVSIKIYLNKKLKGEEFKGITYYPVYARINFLGNNTSVRVSTRSGRPIMLNEEQFEEIEDVMYSGKYPRWLLHKGGIQLHILNREELMEKSILFEYSKQQDRFSFKVFTQKYRRWEKDIYSLLYDRFIDVVKSETVKLTESWNDFNEIALEHITYSESEFNKWKHVLKEGQISDRAKKVGSSLIAIEYFNRCLFQIKKSVRDNLNYIPTERSTIFSWENGEDRDDFIGFVLESIERLEAVGAISNKIAAFKYESPFCDGFREFFSFTTNELESIRSLVDEEIKQFQSE
ncbi:hypothetical protein [Haliscomenobacter hydrossis]|uniref:Uncharacterized protein n=1 Tax=Haliscomenobacter hydrossis (strain ATCC 27775 / DSM 1100 / LMG 10767 / O) TaxID=760192 RepID=F4L6U6_HALH1|nr:hypothetical protein [Haliscomenobacter hydrossis]AEE51901.1 hypothetical protein Halhy_4053 [Haliscomenobacter hydrossis DSM 1100]